jgi:mycoredoxin-dependent peroxiredoxin
MQIEVGQDAPAFDLPDQKMSRVRLADFRGRHHVALVFFPFSFTGVCQGELCDLRDDLASFERRDVQLLAVSCDSSFVHAEWAAEQGFTFPILSDFWPHGTAARAYGVFNESLGCANRVTFVVDRRGSVVATFGSADLGTPRSRSDYEAALAGSPQTRCPVSRVERVARLPGLSRRWRRGRGGTRRSRCPERSEAAQDADDLSIDLHLGGMEDQGLEAVVRGNEYHPVVLTPEGLDRRLTARDAGDDDIALIRHVL